MYVRNINKLSLCVSYYYTDKRKCYLHIYLILFHIYYSNVIILLFY